MWRAYSMNKTLSTYLWGVFMDKMVRKLKEDHEWSLEENPNLGNENSTLVTQVGNMTNDQKKKLGVIIVKSFGTLGKLVENS